MATSHTETFIRKQSWEQAEAESTGYEEAELVADLTARLDVDRPWDQIRNDSYLHGKENPAQNQNRTHIYAARPPIRQVAY